ncbi:MAG: hypothetical protein AAFY14_12960, partial [Pseudomonadota bacterium]
MESDSSSAVTMASVTETSLVAASTNGAVAELSVPSSATYAFTAPAGLAVTLRVGDTEVLKTDGTATGPQRAFTTLDAGTYTVSVYGNDLTAEQVASITASVVGMPAASITMLSPAKNGRSTSADTEIALADTATVGDETDGAVFEDSSAIAAETPVAVRSVPLSAEAPTNNVRGAVRASRIASRTDPLTAPRTLLVG